MKYSGRQATREGAVGKGACWGAPGSSCILSWLENMELITSLAEGSISRSQCQWQFLLNVYCKQKPK